MKRVCFALMLLVTLVMTFVACSGNTAGDKTAATNGEVTGMVFFDENDNGELDSGENGLANVKVIIDTISALTDASGKYAITVSEDELELLVDESTIGAEYTLSTNNSTQTIQLIENKGTADPIGYALKPAESDITIGEILTDTKRYDNYYFELIITDTANSDFSMKLWFMNGSYKSDSLGITTFVNQSKGIMGVYTQANNQVVITPILEYEELVTPFTYMNELDRETFDKVYYKGKEDLDGKSVLVFENTTPTQEMKIYIWEDTGIIIKLDINSGPQKRIVYFKDLTLGNVIEADITYPAGSIVMDLSSVSQ
ncbi:MAG: hypothetical protein CVU84_07820 [Firmicutes bacterium HGW-Firmicutes-1]|jgi:hypothetical protein|nr:MAG: hypothetical protein CVU84_07820 [Firmicutes bacterium HGW-Firmicutes-1]